MDYKKHPIGIMPEMIWKQMRWEELGSAIIRRVEAGCKVPTEWMNEYNKLDGEIKELSRR